MGHGLVGATLYFQGELRDAREHLQEAFELGQLLRKRVDTLPDVAVNDLVATHGYRALLFVLLGYPDQAVQASRESMALARAIGQPFPLAEALVQDAYLHLERGEVEVAGERTGAVIALATEHGFAFWLQIGMEARAIALVEGGQLEAGITELRAALGMRRGAGIEIGRPGIAGVLAAAYGQAGQPAQGLAVIEEAVECLQRTGQLLYEPELYRVKGELLLAISRDNAAQAEECLRHAVDCARRQGGKMAELRVALSLGRLWRDQGKRAEARTLLAEIYGWFTEGFDTVDLQEAKALLEELEQTGS
jgi:predicted ATPase